MKHSVLTLASLITLFASSAVAADRPPNVVLILADDLGWGDVSFNGRKEWSTPHLDQLGKQGTIFNRWYTAAVVCAPSRAALLTGRYGIHNGVCANDEDLPEEEVTLADSLKAHGYATALIGKWHHGKPRPGRESFVHPLQHGFDHFIGFVSAREAWEHFPKRLWYGKEQRDVEGYTSTLFTNHAIDWVKQVKDSPFFLYLAYTEPHLLIEAPAEDVAQYRGKFQEKDPAKPHNATYAAMITRMDKDVGRFLHVLDELGLTKDTIVVFTSDHGATFEGGNQGTANFHDSNHPFRGQKRTLWEGGIRVPGIVRWPGQVPAGKTSEQIVHNIDLMPTLHAATGKPIPAGVTVDGANVLDVWLGKNSGPARTLFWDWRFEGNQQLAAMRDQFKLVITGSNRAELFDVVRDPGERRTLVGEYPEMAKQLETELRAWLATETRDRKPADKQ